MAFKSFWFCNVARDPEGRHLGFFGYKPGQMMELAYPKVTELEVPTPEAALEEMFRIFNIDHPSDYRNRSMSVGDVVLLITVGGWSAFKCDSVGWSRIDAGGPYFMGSDLFHLCTLLLDKDEVTPEDKLDFPRVLVPSKKVNA